MAKRRKPAGFYSKQWLKMTMKTESWRSYSLKSLPSIIRNGNEISAIWLKRGIRLTRSGNINDIHYSVMRRIWPVNVMTKSSVMKSAWRRNIIIIFGVWRKLSGSSINNVIGLSKMTNGWLCSCGVAAYLLG
jgi:hypothetical protein